MPHASASAATHASSTAKDASSPPAKAATTTLTENVAKLADRGNAAIDKLTHQLESVTAKAKTTGFVTLVHTKSYVEKNPMKGLAFAFGLGYATKLLRTGPVSSLAIVFGAAYLGMRMGTSKH